MSMGLFLPLEYVVSEYTSVSMSGSADCLASQNVYNGGLVRGRGRSEATGRLMLTESRDWLLMHCTKIGKRCGVESMANRVD